MCRIFRLQMGCYIPSKRANLSDEDAEDTSITLLLLYILSQPIFPLVNHDRSI